MNKRMRDNISPLRRHNKTHFASQHFTDVIDFLPDAIFVVDTTGKVLAWNRALEEMTGVNSHSIVGKGEQAYNQALYAEKKNTLIDYLLNKRDKVDDRFEQVIHQENALGAEEWLPAAYNGEGAYVWTTASLLHDENRQCYGAIQTIRNISQKKLTEGSLKRVNRALSTLSDVNQAVVQAETEEQLLNNIVQAIVRDNKYRMAWIAYIDNTVEGDLRIMAHAGFKNAESNVRMVCGNKIYGCNPIGEALVEGKYHITKNILARQGCEKCWADANARDYTSTIALPLIYDDQKFGVINIYAREEDAFGHDEVALLLELAGDLSYGINTLRTQQERDKAVIALQDAHDYLEHKVKERTRELMQANEKLKDLDRLKSMFIASMSHELRTPLNSIIGFSGIMLKEMSGPISSKQKEHLERIFGSGKHLMELISDVIDISKIEGDRIDVHPQMFKLDELIAELKDDYSLQAEKKRLQLEFDVNSGIYLFTDRKRLQQVISNLLSNAIKYTEKGHVKVSVCEYYSMVEIVVTDSGIGISKENMLNLFKAFERLETHLKIREGGTGLGLYLTEKLVSEILLGEIEVESEPGVGSTFRVRVTQDLREESVH